MSNEAPPEANSRASAGFSTRCRSWKSSRCSTGFNKAVHLRAPIRRRVAAADNRNGHGVGSIKNGISVPELMKTQLSVLQCPSDGFVRDLSRWQYEFFGCFVALTSYKGVLDDSWIGQADGSLYSNASTPYPSGLYREASTSPVAEFRV